MITDQIRLLQEAKDQADRDKKQLEALLSNMESGVSAIDMERNIVHVNDAQARILGYRDTSKLPLNTRFFERDYRIFSYPERKRIPPEEWPLERLYRGETVNNEKFVISRLDTKWERIVECFGTPIRNVTGVPELELLMLTDISERQQTEEEFRLTQFIFDEAPIGIWRMGSEGEVLDANEQACASLGYTREELCRMTVFDFAPGFDRGAWEIGTQQLHKTGIKTTDALHQRKSGEIFPIQVIEKLMRYEGQEYRLAFVQDISERKKYEESLRFARFIIDRANVGIYRISPEGQVIEVNPKAAQLLGYTKEELESLSMSAIDPLVSRDSWSSNWQKLLGLGVRNLESEHRKKDGSRIPVEIHSNLLEYEGQQYANRLCAGYQRTQKKRAGTHHPPGSPRDPCCGAYD